MSLFHFVVDVKGIGSDDRGTHVLGFHDVAALAHASDGLVDVDQHAVQARRYAPRLAEATACVGRHVELDAVGDADLASVA